MNEQILGVPEGMKLVHAMGWPTDYPNSYVLLGDGLLVRVQYLTIGECGRRHPILEPDNVYRKPLDEVEIPEGWEKVAYRQAQKGEYILSTVEQERELWVIQDSEGKFIILRKKAPKRLVYEEVSACPSGFLMHAPKLIASEGTTYRLMEEETGYVGEWQKTRKET